MRILIFTTVSYLTKNNMKLNSIFLELLFCLTFLFVSCEKEDQLAGLGMLPSSDILNTCVDSTSTLISFSTVVDDSVRSSYVTYMVGENNDDDFGRSRAGYMTRLYLQGKMGDLSEFTLDSASFQLSKSAKYAYGDATVAQSFSVYEILQDITVDDCAKYNVGAQKPSCLSSLSEIMTFEYPAYNDTMSVYRKNLDSEYASNLYNKILSFYNVDSSLQHFDSLFIKKFKGIYVTTKNNQFNNVNSVITHSVPELNFYLSSKDTAVKLVFAPSPQSYLEPLSSDPSQIYMQAINVFEHQYPSEITLNTETTVSYVQGMLGLKSNLKFSGLDIWRDSVMVVNHAKLIVPKMERTSWADYLPLNFRVYDSKKSLVFSTMSSTTDSTDFEFNVQGFLLYLFNHSAKSDTYFYEISVPENNTYGNAFILDGTETEKLKLIITYTK